MSAAPQALAHRVLAALVIGSALAPFVYAAMGALAAFGEIVRAVIGPAGLAVSAVAALVLSVPTPLLTLVRPLAVLAHLAPWAVAILTLGLLSDFALSTPPERFGLLAVVLLCCWAGNLPLTLLVGTAAGRLLAPLPPAPAWGCAAVAALALAVLALSYALSAPSMPG